MSEASKNTLEKVSAEFESEVVAELDEGMAQSTAVIEAARRETAEAVAKILETGGKQAESLKRQVVGAAELQSRDIRLRILEDAINESFAQGTKRLAQVSPSQYEDSITRLIRESTEVIGPAAQVWCNSKDGKLVASVVRKLNRTSMKLSMAEKNIQCIGGVMLTTKDGTVRFDNTFEARLERMRPVLRKEVADLLSGAQN